MTPRVTIFAPHPLLTVTIEAEGESRQSIHFHAGGQGVWVARMVRALGVTPVLCGFIGGESGTLLRPLLEEDGNGVSGGQQADARGGQAAARGGQQEADVTTNAGGYQLRLVETSTPSGCYVTDRRSGRRELVAMSVSDPPTRHELDDLFSRTVAEAIDCGILVVTNPMPGASLPLEIYGDLVADVKGNGCTVLVDLSSPRLDSALKGGPDIVKINDWELAEYIRGPVDTEERLFAAVSSVHEAGAKTAIVTRGEEPGLIVSDGEAWRLMPPRFENGFREGCGDSMLGAMAAAIASGSTPLQAIAIGAAGGAANFLRRGLGNASKDVVEQLARSVRIEPWFEAPGASDAAVA